MNPGMSPDNRPKEGTMNVKEKAATAYGRMKSVGSKVVAGASLMAISAASFAQSTVQADIEGVIDEQKAIALAVVVAGTIAALAIKYSKLVRRA